MPPGEEFLRRRADHSPPPRQELEVRLLPLVRRALRDRAGPRVLVNWVHRNLATLEGSLPLDVEYAAPQLARLLCDVLLRRTGRGDRPGSETVRGP